MTNIKNDQFFGVKWYTKTTSALCQIYSNMNKGLDEEVFHLAG